MYSSGPQVHVACLQDLHQCCLPQNETAVGVTVLLTQHTKTEREREKSIYLQA